MSQKWASDDNADSLLAGILDETEDVARAEQERLEAEMRAKEEEERRKAEEAEQQRRQEAEARLSAERERLEKAEERRTQKLEALRVEELKERGEWIDPAEVARKEAEEAARREAEAQKAREERAKEQAALLAAQQNLAASQAPGAEQGSNKGLMIGAIVALVLVLAAGVGIVVLVGGYQPDSATYTKTVFTPKDVEVAMVEAGFTPIPKAAPVVEEDTPSKSRRTSRRSSRRSSSKSSKPASITGKPTKKNKANKAANELESLLNSSDDIFGGGK